MASGFYVELGALRHAAEGVNDTLNAMAMRKAADIGPPSAAFGHEGLAATVADFCQRWEIGVEHLATDAREVADRLTASVNAYTHVERATQASLNDVARGTGADPAAD